jgi:hypothetical protein
MLEKQKQRLQELETKRTSFRWDIEEIKHADMDPDRKAIYLNDAQCSHYMIEQEIKAIEHELAMFPLKLMLGGFIIFVIGMVIYMTA